MGDNEIMNWVIDLQGRPGDLADCATFFGNGTEICVEREQSGNSIPRYYLTSSEFERVSDTQIHTIADRVIATLNAAQLKSYSGGGPVLKGIPVTIRANGVRVPVNLVTTASRMPVESLTATQSAYALQTENLTGVSRAEAVPLEHLTAVGRTEAMPMESLKSRFCRIWQINKYPFIFYIIIQIAGLSPAFVPWNKIAFCVGLVVSLISTIVGVYAIERVSRIFTTT
jgi:hypothetical protein